MPDYFVNEYIQLVQQSPILVEQVNTLLELYYLIDQLNEAVKFLYPHNACNTGCTTCCEGTSVPVVYSMEWELIYNFIKSLDEDIQKEIAIRARDFYTAYKDILWEIHDNIPGIPSKEKLQKFLELLPQLEQTVCPFLVLGKCGIYPVRPAKCRAHGCFLFQFEDTIQLHACSAELERLEEYLQKQGGRKVLMPIWNFFEKKLVDLHTEGLFSTIIPLWLYAHLEENNKLADNIIRQPDFNKLREKHENS